MLFKLHQAFVSESTLINHTPFINLIDYTTTYVNRKENYLLSIYRQ